MPSGIINSIFDLCGVLAMDTPLFTVITKVLHSPEVKNCTDTQCQIDGGWWLNYVQPCQMTGETRASQPPSNVPLQEGFRLASSHLEITNTYCALDTAADWISSSITGLSN